MIERTLWHPVALSADLAGNVGADGGAVPLSVRLLGEDLVLWRDAQGTLQAWADRCPHRGARLSLGRVVSCAGGTALECPYHGWQFDAQGRCVRVPALPDFTPPAGHRAQVHAAHEAYGLVWVRLAHAQHGEGGPALPAGEPALPPFEAEHDPGLYKIDCGPYDVQTSAPRIVENFLDMAHFGFVHEGWLGAREFTAIDDYRVEATPTGLLATGCKAWQPQATLHSTRPAQVEYRYELTAPYAAVLTKVPEAASVSPAGSGAAAYRESIALFICPVEPEHSRVWFRFATSDFGRDAQAVRAFQHTIFLQDQPVLESQRPRRLPLDLRAELHTAADKASSFYRRHLKALGITFGVC